MSSRRGTSSQPFSPKLTILINANVTLMPVVPLLSCAPLYLSGAMPLGSMMQIAAAFVQTQFAFNWFFDNFIRIADWEASARRVVGLRAAFADSDRSGSETPPGPGDAPSARLLRRRDRTGDGRSRRCGPDRRRTAGAPSRVSSWVIFSEFKEFAGFFQQVFELFSITIDLFSEPGLTARLHSPIFHITIVVNALRRLCE